MVSVCELEFKRQPASYFFQDPPMKTVFTTGEAAKICKVSQQTIIRCFDSGQLKGFRVPGSRFRRIPRDQLYAFMALSRFAVAANSAQSATDGQMSLRLVAASTEL